MGILKRHPFLRGIFYHPFALIGRLECLEIRGLPYVGILLEHTGNRPCRPIIWGVRVVSFRVAGSLKFQCGRGGNFSFLEDARNFPRPVALNAELENQLHYGLGFLVDDQASIRAPDVAIGRSDRDSFPGHSFVAEHRPQLFAGVLCVPLVHNVAEWGEVVVRLVFTVHAVIDRYKTDAQLRETDFRVKPYFQVVAAEPGHILDDHHTHQSGLNIGQHFLKPRPLEIRPGVSVILINLVVGDTMLFCISGQYFDLRLDLSRGFSL